MRKAASLLTVVPVVVLLNALLAWIYWAPPQVVRDVPPSEIRPETGYAFLVLAPRARLPFLVADDATSSRGSHLVLLEDGRPLGPAHAAHAEIRSRGHGRYSHWGGEIYFSSSDGTDPRINGRRYKAVTTVAAANVLVAVTFTIDAALLLLYARSILLILGRHPAVAGYAASGMLISFAAAMALGVFEKDLEGKFADSSLVWSTVWYAMAGCALALLQWCSGSGLARLLCGRRHPHFAELGLLGVPLGLVATTLAAIIALTVPGGRLIAGCLLAACLLSLCWGQVSVVMRGLRTAAPSVGALMLVSASFASWLALHWHGPTATLPGFPSGDLTYYASSIWALAAQPSTSAYLPLEGAHQSYWNLRLPALGAVLLRSASVDGFLFIAATVPAMGLTGLGLALKAFFATLPRESWRTSTIAFVALALIGAGRYPYWLAESPPVSELGLLTIGTWFYARNSNGRPLFASLSFVLAMLSAALSKVVAAVALGGLALATVAKSAASAPRAITATLWIVALLGLIYPAAMLYRYLPFYVSTVPLGPESVDLMTRWQQPLSAAWPYITRDMSAVLLAALAFRVLPTASAVPIAVACAASLTYAFLMRANFVCAMTMMALVYAESPALLPRTRWHAGVTVALALPPMVLFDPTGLSTGIVWALTIALIAIFSLPGMVHSAGTTDALRRFTRPVATAWAIGTVLVLVASARGTVPLRNSFVSGPAELTPDVRELWILVREHTPEDALIFTDQTAADSKLLGGWNTYVMHGQRQVFVADLTQSGRLRTDRASALSKLQTNESVLNGEIPPAAAGLRGQYFAYYAAVSAHRVLGPQWRPVQKVGSWALYVWSDAGRPGR